MPDFNQQLVDVISAQLPDIDAGQVAQVLQTWRDVLDGDPVGTIRRNSDGRVAHRVTTDGIFLWRVTGVDGDQYNDMQPTLQWPAVYTPGDDE